MCITEYGFEVSARMTVKDWRLWTWWAVGSFSDTDTPLGKTKSQDWQKETIQATTGSHPSQRCVAAPFAIVTSSCTLRALLQTSAVHQLVFRIKYNLCSFHSASFTCTWVHVYCTPVTALTANPFNFLSMLLSHHDVLINWCMYRLVSLNYLFFLKGDFGLFLFLLILKYCSDVAAVSHKGRKESYLKMDLNP